jgi:predicted transcriptional regulator
VKTLAIRLDDELHAQLSVLAQLEEVSITDAIRQAIEAHIEAKRSQPELAARAESVLAAIDAEAANRRGAIATLFSSPEPKDEAGATSAGRRKARPGSES